VKALAKIMAALLVLAIFAWTGTFLYWRFKLQGAIRGFIAQSQDGRMSYIDHNENFQILRQSGCRSLPYLVDALDTSGYEVPLEQALDMIFSSKVPRTDLPPGAIDQDLVAGMAVMDQCIIRETDSPQERLQKCAQIRAWWRESGSKYHQWWRVWSSKCR
jgi:hypothetical protein